MVGAPEVDADLADRPARPCIDRAESAYLISGALPARGTTCLPDAPPFGAPARATVQRQAALPFMPMP